MDPGLVGPEVLRVGRLCRPDLCWRFSTFLSPSAMSALFLLLRVPAQTYRYKIIDAIGSYQHDKHLLGPSLGSEDMVAGSLGRPCPALGHMSRAQPALCTTASGHGLERDTDDRTETEDAVADVAAGDTHTERQARPPRAAWWQR